MKEAGTGFLRVSRDFGSLRGVQKTWPDLNGKEGVAGSESGS